MNSRTPEPRGSPLMCSDHEVAEFTWNHDRQAVTGKTHVLDAAHAPLWRPTHRATSRATGSELVQEQGASP